jgi:sigma-E processing peptidase SpoIIGA
MNFLALSLTGRVMNVVYKKSRVLLSSFLGGVYAVVAVVFAFPGALHVTVGLLLSALLVLIAFGKGGRISLFLRSFVLFYFSSVLLGGGIEALFALLEQSFGMRGSAVLRPADAVLVFGFLAYFILRFCSRFLSGGGLPHSVNVSIAYGGRTVSLPLLVDSGCFLSDPITGKGAILVSHTALRTLFPAEIIAAATGTRVSMPESISLARRSRLLPMKGAGGERLLLAFRPDEVRLLSDGATLDVWVAIYAADTVRFGGCRGLLPATLLYARDCGNLGKKSRKTKKRSSLP